MNGSASPQPHGTCPDRDALFAFNVGHLPPAACATLADHVGGCARCLATLETLDDGSDMALAELRRPVPAEPFAPEVRSAVQRLVAKLGDLPAGTRDSPSERSTLRLDPEQWGDYQILERLGQGGMGTVYKALQKRLGKIVALKVLPPDRLGDPRAVTRFQREMMALGGLEHPNIVRAHDAREENGVPFLVMEYVEGMDLGRLVQRVGPLPVADACAVIRQAARGLHHAHVQLGLVHRDIKPSNLMVTPQGGVKVLDLGLARWQAPAPAGAEPLGSGAVSTDARLGTVDYMAPEQWLDTRVDVRADVYSLGCTLYHLLAGEPPFAGPACNTAGKKMLAHSQEPVPPIRDRRSDVPAALAAVLEQMLAKQPDARPATPAAVAEALEPFTPGGDLARLLASASQAPAVPQAVAAAEPLVPPRRSVRRRWLLAAALRLAALAAAIAWGIPWIAGMSGPVDITTMTIHHWSHAEPRTYLGVIGAPSSVTHFRDFVRVESQLSRPGFCYLVVYKPNGQDELCYPRSTAARTRELHYPPDENGAYCLDDDVGTQAFILIAARQPLPPYADGRRSVDQTAWQQLAADVAWSFDGQDFAPLDGRPRSEQPLHPRVQPFEVVCQELKAYPGVAAIRGVVFPVRAQPIPANP